MRCCNRKICLTKRKKNTVMCGGKACGHKVIYVDKQNQQFIHWKDYIKQLFCL